MIRRFLILSTAVLVSGVVHAQTPAADELAERLDVSHSTAAVVAEVLEETEREPGYLWSVAAELSQRLTDAQKAEMLAARPAVRERGPRGEVRQRGAAGVMQHLPRLARELELTSEQQAQLRVLQASHAPQIRELMRLARTGDADPAELRLRSRELKQEVLRETDGILTTDQQARARELLQAIAQRYVTEQRPQRRSAERRARPDAEQRRSALAERRTARDQALNLTDEQRAQAEELHAARRQALRERREAAGVDRPTRGHMRLYGGRQTGQAFGDVLTEQQHEIVRIHALLARTVMARTRR